MLATCYTFSDFPNHCTKSSKQYYRNDDLNDTTFDFFLYGDYCGSSYNWANQECFKEWLTENNYGFEVVSYGYGSKTIQFDTALLSSQHKEDLLEILCDLEQYPLWSDEKHSEIQSNEYWEQWDIFVTEDCLKATFTNIVLDDFDLDNNDLKQVLTEIHSNYDNGSSRLENTSYYYNFDCMKNLDFKDTHKIALALNKAKI